MNFLKKIFFPTILVISFLLLIYTFYRSEIFWGGSKRGYYLTYYFISLILIFVSTFAFFINQKLKEYLIISSISIVASLYLFEGYLIFKTQHSKIIGQSLKEQLYEKQTGNKWDRRSKLEIYKDLKKINNEIVIKVPPHNHTSNKYSIHPLSGISNSKTIYCNENGYYSIDLIDRYGFNNPDTEWDKKEIEYLFIGDSYTHGACVNRPNDIGSVLRSISNKSVLNLGQPGNGPLMQYATLREYLSSNVKKVIWVYYEGNDLKDLEFEKKKNILTNYLEDVNFTQNLKSKQNEINYLAINLIKEKEKKRENGNDEEKEKFKYKLFKFIQILSTRQLILPETAPPPELKKILQLTKELIEKNNLKLYFVYLPKYDRYKSSYDNTNYNLIKVIVTELNIPFIDMHNEVFKKEQNPLKLFPFEMFGHYNIEGYKKVAETIYKFTKD